MFVSCKFLHKSYNAVDKEEVTCATVKLCLRSQMNPTYWLDFEMRAGKSWRSLNVVETVAHKRRLSSLPDSITGA
jgi:hypothetical protein